MLRGNKEPEAVVIHDTNSEQFSINLSQMLQRLKRDACDSIEVQFSTHSDGEYNVFCALILYDVRADLDEQEYLIFVMDDLTNDLWMETAYPIVSRSPMLAAEKFALSCGDTHTVYNLLVEDQEGQQHTFTVTLSTSLEANVTQTEDLDENH